MYNSTQLELLKNFARESDRLFSLGIIRSDSFTGEIGEFVACLYYSLEKATRSTKAVDAFDSNGLKYQIKAKVSNNVNLTLQNRKADEIDYLVIVYFDEDYTPNKIIRIRANQLQGEKTRISNRSLSTIEHTLVERQKIILPKTFQKNLILFGQLYMKLISEKIVNTRRIVGDIGEFYGCYHLGLRKAETPIQKGYDAIDNNGITFEIKTRRVYESDRRKSSTRRVSNLVDKSAQMLCVVVLDRNFGCNGVWTMPMENIANKKSATLRIVNNTKGVVCHVPTTISWLDCDSSKKDK